MQNHLHWTKLASKFNIKDEISKKHKHDLIYKAQCPDLNCDETYIGEIGRRFSERIDHSGRDDKSHLYEHAEKTGYVNVNIDHFEILSNGYKSSVLDVCGFINTSLTSNLVNPFHNVYM